MHPHEPTDAQLALLVAGRRTPTEERRISHLVALNEAAADRPGLLDAVRNRLLRRTEFRPRLSMTLDCCAAG